MAENKNNINHIALYRKYRPQKFEDVYGQEIAIKNLKNSVKENKISNAYLFYGSRGTGKTTVARIFAKEIGSSSDDIFELDAASNRKIEDARNLIENVSASTFGSKYKVYILDEAHMLTKEASNALLKTIEEPPAHVIFILATTDKHKLPKTIVSRCQEIDFVSPDLETLISRLKYISDSEKYKTDSESLNLIARAGNGSYRDAIGVLEKVMNSSDDKNINLEITKNVLGIIDKKEIINIIKTICEKDVNGFINIINKLKLKENNKLEKFYIDFINIFEIALLLRVSNVVKDILCDNVSKETIKAKESLNLNIDISSEDANTLLTLSQNYPKIISSSTLLKLSELENKIIESSHIKESIFVVGVLNVLDNIES